MYISIENRMRLKNLKEDKNLLTALRHLVRCLHEGGRNIVFPIPEAIDRIQLRCSNLSTEPRELQRLVDLVFQRREETLDLEAAYRDFVGFYGRVVFDNTQIWPKCYTVVRTL